VYSQQIRLGGIVARTKQMLRRLAPQRDIGIEIPLTQRTPEEYCLKAASRFKDPKCQIYIDTSFLMWLAKIGPTARQEFVDWIDKTSAGRYVVPVWAAHEYQQHHSRKTVLKEGLEPLVKTINSAGRSLYKQLHPYLQSPLPEGKPDASEQQTEVLELLRDVSKLATTLESWKETFQSNSTDVLAFINKHPALGSGVLEHIAKIQTVGELRYDGRIPPGFQDRGKSARVDTVDGEDVQVGSNRWGDLTFWLEVIQLAKRAKAQTILVLTNDRKNDWKFGASQSAKSTDEALKELADSWNVPTAHPMLVYEAANSAGASDVLLVDALSLSGILALAGESNTANLRRAASVPTPPAAPTRKQDLKSRARAAMSSAASVSPDVAPETSTKTSSSGVPSKQSFAAASAFKISAVTLRLALEASRQPIQGRPAALVETCVSAWQAGRSLVDEVTSHGFDGFAMRDVVAFARGMHEEALTDPAVASLPMSDLVDALDEWDEAVASSIYLGFLASAYFEPGTLKPRIVAENPQLQALLEKFSSDFGCAPVEAIAKKLEAGTPRPIYLPNTTERKVSVRIRHEIIDDKILISSMLLDDLLIFEEAQGHKELQLRELLGVERANAEAIAHTVGSVYAIPVRQIAIIDSPTQEFEISPTAGLVAPKSVPRTKESK
jgi:PIN like domain